MISLKGLLLVGIFAFTVVGAVMQWLPWFAPAAVPVYLFIILPVYYMATGKKPQ